MGRLVDSVKLLILNLDSGHDQFLGLNPVLGSVLTVWSLLGILCLPLSLPCSFLCSLSLSKVNKQTNKQKTPKDQEERPDQHNLF